MPLTATSTHCGSGRKGAGKSKVKLAYNDGAPESMGVGSGSGVDNYGAAVVIQTAARAFLARRRRRAAAARKIQAAALARRRRRAAAARKIQAAAWARQARLLEAFIESLVFFPELGDIAFYDCSA